MKLSIKISIIIVVTIIIVMGIETFFIIKEQREVLNWQMEQKADILINALKFTLIKNYKNNFKNIKHIQIIAQALEDILGVKHIGIYDLQKKIIVDTDKKRIGKILAKGEDKYFNQVLKIKREIIITQIKGKEKIYRKIAPISTEIKDKREIAGFIEVDMSILYLEEQISKMYIKIIGHTLAVGLLIIIILIWFLRKSVTSPIKRLVEASELISHGNLEHKIIINSKDELGELSNSFNKMTSALKKSYTLIQNKNEELTSINKELKDTQDQLLSLGGVIHNKNLELANINEELEISNEGLRTVTEEIKQKNKALNEAQDQLIRSEKLAAIGLLSASISHELKNPLGIMKNAVYYIKTKINKDDPKVLKHMEILDKEIDISNKIIIDLLAFSRAKKPVTMPVEVNEIIEETLAGMVNSPENIRLIKELGFNIPKALVDKDQIRQVFLNIISNAYQSMQDHGELKIISAYNSENKMLEVKFSDTGSGITQDNLAKIFDPLFTTKAKGFGLGLSVCKAIIEKHDGYIKVESEFEKGTVFTIGLPAYI